MNTKKIKSFNLVKLLHLLSITITINMLYIQDISALTELYQQFPTTKICKKNYIAYGRIDLNACLNKCEHDNNCMGVHYSQQRFNSNNNVNSCYSISQSTCSGIKTYDVSNARDFTLYKRNVSDSDVEGTVCLTDEHCGSLKCIENECYGARYTKFPIKQICKKNYKAYGRVDINTCLNKCEHDFNCMGIHFSHQRFLANDNKQNSCYTISQSTCSGIKNYDVSNARDFTIYKKNVDDSEIEGTVCLTDEHCGSLKCINNECYGDRYAKLPIRKICNRNYKAYGKVDINTCFNKCEHDDNCMGIHFSHTRYVTSPSNTTTCYTLSKATCSGIKSYASGDFSIYKRIRETSSLKNTVCITDQHCGEQYQCDNSKCK